MRAVNLLPSDLQERRKPVPLPVLVACAGIALAAALLTATYVSASASVGERQDRLAELTGRLAALPRPETTPQTVTSLAQERNVRIAALSAALSQRVPWDRVLREVSLVLPEDVWLTSLDASVPASSSTEQPSSASQAAPATDGFTLVGFTYSQDAVARLLARLSVVPDLDDVSLQQATKSDLGRHRVVQFTIAANIRGGGTS